MLQLIWQDGYRVTGSSWRELEGQARASSPWSPRTRTAWRRVMRQRARMWSGRRIRVSVFASSARFLSALEDAGLVRIDWSDS